MPHQCASVAPGGRLAGAAGIGLDAALRSLDSKAVNPDIAPHGEKAVRNPDRQAAPFESVVPHDGIFPDFEAMLFGRSNHDRPSVTTANGTVGLQQPSVDEYGSPVSLEAVSWLVCFVPGLKKQWWHRFVRGRHKHVFAMRPEENGMWILFEPWWRRLLTTSLTTEQARQFLLWAAAGDVLLVREAIPGRSSQFRGWANCAVLVSFLLGRGYRTWTPRGVYNRLTREVGVRVVNVSMLLSLETEQLEAASRVLAARNWQDDRGERPSSDSSGWIRRLIVSNLTPAQTSATKWVRR